jgi:hypothetical protein
MVNSGLSTLEIRSLIERALLPDHCRCECIDGRTLQLTLQATDENMPGVFLSDIPLESLQSSRAIAELVGEARYRLVQSKLQQPPSENGSRGA